MAVFNPTVETSFSCFIDYLPLTYSFEETVARLNTLAQYNIFSEGDQYKTTFEVRGTFEGQVFTLYDYKGDNLIHIGGYTSSTLRLNKNKNLIPLNVTKFKECLTKMIENTQPTSFVAYYHYDDLEGYGYQWN